MKLRVYGFCMLLLLVGCSRKADAEIILSDMCSPPCWENVVPGLSTETNVKEIEEKLPSIDAGQTAWIYEWNKYDAVFAWRFLNSEVKKGEIYIKGGVVELINLFGGFNVPLKTLVNKFGEPEYVVIGNTITPGFLGAGYQNQVNLIYEEDGMIVSLKPDVNASIKPTTKIDSVIFFVPALSEKIIREWVSPGLLGELKIWDWQGYGRFTIEGERK